MPNTPRDDRKLPDATISVIGSLAAFDHWRQRVYMLESVPLIKLNNIEIDAAYDAAIERIKEAVADLTKPLSYVAVEPPRAEDYKSSFDPTKNGNSYQRAVLAAKSTSRLAIFFRLCSHSDLMFD